MATTRLDYRNTREPTAVCVYTISQESRYITIKNVPSLGLEKELLNKCNAIGDVEEHALLTDQSDPSSSDSYTDAFWVKFRSITSARIAKKKLDDKPFYSNLLKVMYAPEYETFEDIRQKFQERMHAVQQRLHKLNNENNKSKTAFGRPKRSRRDSQEVPVETYGPFVPTAVTGAADHTKRRRRI